MTYRRSIASICLIVFSLSTCLPLLAQRARTPAKSPQQTTKTQATQTIPLAFDELNDFVAKGLPAAAEAPTGNLDQAAVLMARKISKLDKDSLPVLLAALQTAGFAVVDENRKVLLKPRGDGKGQGLLFFDWETVGMLKLAKPRVETTLDKLTAAITKETPELPASKLSAAMLQDLRRQADSSENAFVRFWARLIIELGKASAQPIDLMTAQPGNINLSLLQASLWMRRLVGDLHTFNNRQATGQTHPRSEPRNSFAHAGSRTKDGSPLRTASFSVPTDCHLTETEALILDAGAFSLTAGHDAVFDLIKEAYEHSPAAKSLAKLGWGLWVVNVALAWLKLVAAVTTIHGKLEVEGSLPLLRTKNSTPGESRLMKAKFTQEIGRKEMLNCVRLALNIATGLDFSLPIDCALAGKAVEWRFVGDNETRVNDAGTRNLQKFVTFVSPDDRGPEDQVTNDKGISEMNIVGLPKVPAVVYFKAMEVEKQADVQVSIRLKSAKDVKQNLIDIAGIALNVATTGPLALVVAISEIGFRLPFVEARATIPVTDHEPCDGQWQGTVTYTSIVTHTSKQTSSAPPRDRYGAGSNGGYLNQDQTITQSGTVTVNSNGWLANSSADEIFVQDESSSGSEFCHGGLGGPKGPLVPWSSTGSITSSGGGGSRGKLTNGISLDKDSYQVSIKPLTVNGTVQSTTQDSTSGGCPPNKPSTSLSHSSNKEYGSSDYIVGRANYGADRNILSGSDTKTTSLPSTSQTVGRFTTTGSYTRTTTITWMLRRCN